MLLLETLDHLYEVDELICKLEQWKPGTIEGLREHFIVEGMGANALKQIVCDPPSTKTEAKQS